jgi:hypothetical protein
MTKAKNKAVRLLRKYDRLRAELRATEQELTAAIRVYADEQKFGWYDRDKLRVALMIERELSKEKAA